MMSYVIALAGKGGTGKTTICALLAGMIIRAKRGSLLAIDADPNDNLAQALGVPAGRTISDILDDLSKNQGKVPAGMAKDRYLEYELQSAVTEADGFDILTMGRPEGPGCYCYVNNVLRGVIARLVCDYDYVVIDNEAGLEHLSRKTTGKIDLLLTVSDASVAGVRAAERIVALADSLSLKVTRKALLINKSPSEQAIGRLRLPSGLECIGYVPYDLKLAEAGLDGTAVKDLAENSSAFSALKAAEIF